MIAEYVEKDPTKFCTYDEFESGVTALKEFCTLRAESISGQLNGTIPSTSDGQTADSSSLIMAEGLNISDMGTMNNGGGSPDGKAQSNTAQTKSAADNTNTTNDKSFSQTPPNNSESSSDGTDNSTNSDSSVPTGDFGGTPPICPTRTGADLLQCRTAKCLQLPTETRRVIRKTTIPPKKTVTDKTKKLRRRAAKQAEKRRRLSIKIKSSFLPHVQVFWYSESH